MKDLRSRSVSISISRLVACTVACLASLALANGCGPPARPGQAKPSAGAPGTGASASPSFDPCIGSPPVPHAFSGILRVARCDQHMFLTMASVATQMGVECAYCHVPNKTDPKKEDYPVMTPRKEVANWMSMHLMQAIKPADGTPMKCKSCHVDDDGKPVAKILGNPRDPEKASEWMSLVMTKKFVTMSGERLKCKSCHVGGLGSPTWHPKVILQSDQLPPHAIGGAGPAL